MSITNLAAKLIFGSLVNQPEPAQPYSVLNAGVTELRRRGHSVHASDIPGLFEVSGLGELTTGQVKSFAPRPLSPTITEG